MYIQGHYVYFIGYNIQMPSANTVNFVQYKSSDNNGNFVQVRTQQIYVDGFNILNKNTSMEGYEYWYFSIGGLS